MRGLLLYAFIGMTLATQSWAGEWKLIEHGGRDYVTLGNVASFYELGSIRRVGNSRELGTSDRNLRARGGSNELYINNLKFILSYPVVDHDGQLMVSRMDLTKVIEPVLRPSRIKDADKVDTIILDPGHGGHDRGAKSRFGAEAHFTLDTALRTRDLLRRLGFKVYLTRESNVFIPLDARVKFANKFPNAILVSIHYNSGQPGAAGVETYTLAPRGVPSTASDGPRISDLQLCAGNSHDAANMALATATHAALVSKLAPFDRGIKRARFVVIRDIAIPGVLIEGGFLSNPGEASRVASAAYRQNLASAIASALQNYRLAVSPRQTPSTVGPLVELNSRATSPRRRVGEARPHAPTVLTPTATR